ncbi:MAG TPA: hypothetical protein VKA68_18300, partial [bacterium]|nr:hypothetical protein [bacterium]
IDPCTYCLLYQEDGRCTCAADLRAGKEPCPECLGEWINRRGAMYAWMDFQGVYPDLAGWLVGRGGPPATCPMMAGRRGGTGMMGMMRGRYDDQYTRLPESLQKMQVTLLAKSRELKELSDYNCCLKGGGSCTYCLRDVTRTAATICDCKDRLQLGQEICPECLGNWASEEWNPELKDAFQRVYPSLSRVVRPE